MRQVWITRRGGPDVLAVRDAPDPEPGPGEVRIRVSAAGVNFADVLARMGLYPDAPPLPCVIGYEVAGVVDAVGPGEATRHEGERVLALTHFGGYSDMVVVPTLQVLPVPGRIGLEAAAAIPVNYLTAWLMLVELGNVSAGQRVLVHSAAGGVGQAAVQICRWRGATVVGTASASKHARLRELGVEHVVDSRADDVEAAIRAAVGEVDIALDPVGGASLAASYRLLAPLGRLFTFGASSLATGERRNLARAVGGMLRTPRFRAFDLMNDNHGVLGVNIGHLWDRRDMLHRALSAVCTRVEAGDFEPVIDRTYDFTHAPDAHRFLQGRQGFGKVLLTPN